MRTILNRINLKRGLQEENPQISSIMCQNQLIDLQVEGNNLGCQMMSVVMGIRTIIIEKHLFQGSNNKIAVITIVGLEGKIQQRALKK